MPQDYHRVENGLWCLGCESSYREWSPNKSCEIVSGADASESDVEIALDTPQHVARSEAGSFEHIAHCSGAKELVPGLDGELE